MKTYEMTTINGVEYNVYKMRNSWDLNYHFIDKNGVDHLVDLQDVIEWKYDKSKDLLQFKIDNEIEGASMFDAIEYANEMSSIDENGVFYWKTV